MQAVTITQITASELEAIIENSLKKIFLVHLPAVRPPSDQWFNLTQLCEYLPDKPAKATVYGWVNKKSIPHHKKSKALSFLRSEIDSWLMDGRRYTEEEIANNVATETDSYLLTRKIKKPR